jgi:hypothetical protein
LCFGAAALHELGQRHAGLKLDGGFWGMVRLLLCATRGLIT